MIELKFRFINRSGKMIVSDPCLNRGVKDCLSFEPVSKGVWIGSAVLNDKFEMQSLKATHEDSRIMSSVVEENIIHCYSEQIGVFDDTDYHNDAAVDGKPREDFAVNQRGDKWYAHMAYITNQSKHGVDAYDWGVVGEMEEGEMMVTAQKSINGRYVQFEIKL